jgi:hypothetical protein
MNIQLIASIFAQQQVVETFKKTPPYQLLLDGGA